MCFLQLHLSYFVPSCLSGLGYQEIKVTIRSHKKLLTAKENSTFTCADVQRMLKHVNKSPFLFQGKENRMVTTP